MNTASFSRRYSKDGVKLCLLPLADPAKLMLCLGAATSRFEKPSDQEIEE
jgi:hypothetical protein